MATPFKMKGHTLPGINQRSEGNTDSPDGRSKASACQKQSPMKEPISLTALLAGAAISTAVGTGTSAIVGSHKKKEQKKANLEKDALNKSDELASTVDGDIGSKSTKIV